MNLDELLHVLPFYKTTSMIDEIKVDGIEMDSREVKQGSVFVCIPGFTVDGHDFIDDAVKQGAVALIVEKLVEAPVPVILVDDTNRALSMLAGKFFNYPTSKLPLIGVTGTNGKTTVTYLLEEIFKCDLGHSLCL